MGRRKTDNLRMSGEKLVFGKSIPTLGGGMFPHWHVNGDRTNGKKLTRYQMSNETNRPLRNQTAPKQTTLDVSRVQSAPVNALDQEERLAVIRKKRKIA